MSRRIIVRRKGAVGAANLDDYFDRILKYIPADVVGLWVTASGIIASEPGSQATLLWIMFGVGVVLTAVWTKMRTDEEGLGPAWTQIAVATGSFIVWVFALGGPFVTLAFYRPTHGSLLLLVYTVVVGRIVPKE